jgi:hypothetical protein
MAISDAWPMCKDIAVLAPSILKLREPEID